MGKSPAIPHPDAYCMNEHLRQFLSHLPFIGLAITRDPILISGLIQATVVGAIMLYGSVQIIGTKLDDMGRDLRRVVVTQSIDASRLRAVERSTAINSEAIRLLLREARHEGK